MADNPEDMLISDILTEFLEVAIHSILYLRRIYPHQIFTLRKKYQIPIKVSKHPKVNEYISECLKTIRYLLKFDSVNEVVVVIEKDKEMLEKYVFSMELKRGPFPDDYFVWTEEIFRQFLLKLTVVADTSLRKLPENCTFGIRVTTNTRCYVQLNEDPDFGRFPWVEAEVRMDENSMRIVPVKTTECSLFNLNMYVEK